MPVDYNVSADGLYVEARASGVLTTEEVCEYEAAVDADDRVKPGFRELFDTTGISGSVINTVGLERIFARSRDVSKKSSKLAIVVSQGSSFKKARTYEGLAQGVRDVIVFNYVKTARTWLGVDDTEAG